VAKLEGLLSENSANQPVAWTEARLRSQRQSVARKRHKPRKKVRSRDKLMQLTVAWCATNSALVQAPGDVIRIIEWLDATGYAERFLQHHLSALKAPRARRLVVVDSSEVPEDVEELIMVEPPLSLVGKRISVYKGGGEAIELLTRNVTLLWHDISAPEGVGYWHSLFELCASGMSGRYGVMLGDPTLEQIVGALCTGKIMSVAGPTQKLDNELRLVVHAVGGIA